MDGAAKIIERTVKENLDLVKSSIRRISMETARASSEIELMLVTKTVPVEKISAAFELGCHLFGENKVQEVVQKWVPSNLSHIKPDFIGHLQTNKVKICLDVCGRIHSVDRIGLVEALDRELQKRGEEREVFLQVNTSDEASKYGVSVNDAIHFAKIASRYQTLKITGLMTLALFSEDTNKIRPCFRKLKELRSQLQDEGLFGEDFRHLSMGMSSDYPVAIEEGATIVRVGTAIFGNRPTPDSYYWPGEEKK